MKSKLFMILFFILLISECLSAKDIPYTLEDRDRLIRVEAKLESFEKRFEQIDKRFEQIDKRFEAVDKRFESFENRFERLENFIIGGLSLLFTGMLAMVGFIMWDRRSVVNPVIQELKNKDSEITKLKLKEEELERREQLLESVLKEYSKTEPKLAELLKMKGLL